MTPMDLVWVKATASAAANACLELVRFGNMIAVRGSKKPEVHLLFTQDEMAAFLTGVKAGEFDHIVVRGAD
jgi:hypothetical protein